MVPISTSVKDLLSKTVQTVLFGDKCGNVSTITSLTLSSCDSLRVFRVGSASFSYALTFTVKDMPALEALVVEEWCFAKKGKSTAMTITNCGALTEVSVGSHSMEEWRRCVVEGCEALVVLSVEDYCFRGVSELRVEGECGGAR